MRQFVTITFAALVLGAAATLAKTLEVSKEEQFRRRCAELAAQAAQTETIGVEGADGFHFLWSELRSISAGKFWGDAAAAVAPKSVKDKYADPLPAILGFRDGLEAIGVELLIVPVPPKAFVFPDKVLDGVKTGDQILRLDEHHRAFYKLLRSKGVNVLDLTDALIARRAKGPGDRRPYCRTDSHWSGRGLAAAAEAVADRIEKGKWLDGVEGKPTAYEVTWRKTDIRGDLVGEEGPKETLELGYVSDATGDAPEPSTSSPVILLGDSHTLVFHMGGEMHAKGAGLADHLAAKLGRPVDLLGKMGSGATSARIDLYHRGARDGDYWPAKKLVVWCFSAREFTEATWMKVPVVRK